MFFNIIISELADEDIEWIGGYVYDISRDKLVAINLKDQIYSTIFSLKFLPRRYQVLYKELRSVNIKSYIVIYRIQWKDVQIVRVLWQSQNYKNYL